MSNILFPQSFSLREVYPGDTTLKLYGVIPVHPDTETYPYVFTNGSNNVFRWYTNTMSHHNYINGTEVPFGNWLPALGENFILHIVNDLYTGSDIYGADQHIYPDDVTNYGGMGTNVLCTTLTAECTEQELLEHSNIFDYESCCVGTHHIEIDLTPDDDTDDSVNLDLLSMSLRMCPNHMYYELSGAEYTYGEVTAMVDEYGMYVEETRAIFVKSSDFIATNGEVCNTFGQDAGEIVIHKEVGGPSMVRWFIDKLNDHTGFGG